ncbi:MAG: hypothetical protein RBR43_00275 [Desulfuromonadaceae bacterium]|nr:hypothetical protein [Desulfuromonas sp.]MDY0184295.1 hypothetical protein [Desulfuromonadaceae bacterium]
MKKVFLCLMVIAFAVFSLIGCASKAPQQSADTQKPAQIIGEIPSSSKFDKISLGMSMKQVSDLIGPPTDTKYYMTGKAFIPFYLGHDRSRFETLYKEEGRITFTGSAGIGGSGYKVYQIIYDPTEDGYN